MAHKAEIVSLLREGRLSQTDIAKKVGVSHGYVSRLRKECLGIRYKGFVLISDPNDVKWIRTQMQSHSLDFNDLINAIITDARLEDNDNGT